jgi:hypothetical protein
VGAAEEIDRGMEHAFLLTPMPEPNTLVLAGSGTIGRLMYVRRARTGRSGVVMTAGSKDQRRPQRYAVDLPCISTRR